MTVFNGKLFFRANVIHGSGRRKNELWVSDGTAAGTTKFHQRHQRFKDIGYGMTVFNGELFFSALTGTYGWELWVSDGTRSGAAMVKDINADSSHSNPVRVPSNLAHTLALVTAPPPHQPLLTHSAAVRYDRLQRPAILRGRRWHPWQ